LAKIELAASASIYIDAALFTDLWPRPSSAKAYTDAALFADCGRAKRD
jgi:hypothetical protein